MSKVPLVDFDAWLQMFKDDPAMFEENRIKYVNAHIEEMCKDDPEKAERMKGFFWRSQQNFRNIKDPVERVNQVVAQFWSQVNKLQDVIGKGLKDV